MSPVARGAMGAVWLTFLNGQAWSAIDDATGPGHREYAESGVTGLLTSMPSPRTLDHAAAATRD